MEALSKRKVWSVERSLQLSGVSYREAIMIFLPQTRYLSLDAEQKLSGRSEEALAAPGARCRPCNMSRVLIVVVTCACLGMATSRPVRRTLNFNMFLLQPHKGASDRFLITTDGISRFGPILEYFVQRVQGMMSVKLPTNQNHHEGIVQPSVPQRNSIVPIADASENEIDGAQQVNTPGVIVRPSQTKPGTYEVEINVVVDDGQPDDKKNPKITHSY